MQVKLTKVSRTTSDKEGNALKTKDGRPYTRISIKTEQHADKYLSGFENADTKNWKEGDTVEIDVTENGQYLNFKVPKKEDKVYDNTETILNKMVGMQLTLDQILAAVKPAQKKVEPVDEEDYTDGQDDSGIPF